jgi:M6 family metalloprotease-like protein
MIKTENNAKARLIGLFKKLIINTLKSMPIGFVKAIIFYNMKNIIFPILCAIGILITVQSCQKPAEVVGPFCATGLDVTNEVPTNVPSNVQQMVYGTSNSGNWYGATAKLRTRKLVIVPILYQGLVANPNMTPAFIRNAFFANNTGSIRDYFYNNSWGGFELQEGGINNGYTNLYPLSTYSAAFSGDPTLNTQLYLDALTGTNVDWNAVDVNHDSQITEDEALIVLLTPEGDGFTPCGAMREFGTPITFPDNLGSFWTIPAGSNMTVVCVLSANTANGTTDISYNYSTIWHELCHALFGLPDRYQGPCGTGWVGHYDLMSNNCGSIYMNIVDKIKLGWLTPAIITDGSSEQCYEFPASEAAPGALVIWDQDVPNQWFVVENRNRSSAQFNYDSGISDDGLAIWWVNESETNQFRRISLVDGRSLSAGVFKSPHYGNTIGYSGGELGVLLKGISCTEDNCPTIFLKYGDADSTRWIHGVRTVGNPGAVITAAVY